jgi:hypothetical protein
MIAYRLWRDGKHKAKVRPGREWLPIATGVLDDNGKPIEIPIGKVGDYINAEFWRALDIYNDYCLFGEKLPYAGGTAEQPYPLYRILKLFIAESNRWDRLEREKKYGRGKGNT